MEENRSAIAQLDCYHEQTARDGSPYASATRPRLLANTPIPIVNFRTNSDFPASELPASQWGRVARPPVPFDEATYSECARSRGLRVLLPAHCESLACELEGGHTVIFDGMDYVVGTIVQDVITPTAERMGATTSTERRGYWLREKIYDAIYGQVRCGTVLRKLNSPVQVMLPLSSSSSSSSIEEWAFVEWIVSVDESVAIKEMSWEHIQTQRMELAEDPIKEVAAMQYLQRWADDEHRQQQQQQEEEARMSHHRHRHPTSLGQKQQHRRGDGESHRSARLPDDEQEVTTTTRSTIERSHIMMPMDLLSDEYNLYSITPFCNGGRLLDRVESKSRFSEPEARYWMRQILEGLSCLKRSGVCHRDMSPENLMVHEDNVYIIDLGMCLRIPAFVDHTNGSYTDHQHQQRSLILPQSACGKWYYLSPEVCESEQPFDGPAVDLWAAGVILFIMLTGLPPWEEPKMTDENFKLMSTGYLVQILTERRAGLSADAMDLLQRMFWLDPADRLSLEQVWAHPWMAHKDILPFSNEK
mmetsp:Transcript_21415/g.44746  ORF Transcript_21415/g.44746 Transcript_21415/m.44746 type:complete len:529 (+) Transcript_21415:123-1709(+)